MKALAGSSKAVGAISVSAPPVTPRKNAKKLMLLSTARVSESPESHDIVCTFKKSGNFKLYDLQDGLGTRVYPLAAELSCL